MGLGRPRIPVGARPHHLGEQFHFPNSRMKIGSLADLNINLLYLCGNESQATIVSN